MKSEADHHGFAHYAPRMKRSQAYMAACRARNLVAMAPEQHRQFLAADGQEQQGRILRLREPSQGRWLRCQSSREIVIGSRRLLHHLVSLGKTGLVTDSTGKEKELRLFSQSYPL
jgi:hypothetical protein